jgi:hypothetical protein
MADGALAYGSRIPDDGCEGQSQAFRRPGQQSVEALA